MNIVSIRNPGDSRTLPQTPAQGKRNYQAMRSSKARQVCLLVCGRRMVAAGLAALTLTATQAAIVTFYVALDGNDQWSGHLAAPDAARNDGPLATLPAAIRAARLAR